MTPISLMGKIKTFILSLPEAVAAASFIAIDDTKVFKVGGVTGIGSYYDMVMRAGDPTFMTYILDTDTGFHEQGDQQ